MFLRKILENSLGQTNAVLLAHVNELQSTPVNREMTASKAMKEAPEQSMSTFVAGPEENWNHTFLVVTLTGWLQATNALMWSGVASSLEPEKELEREISMAFSQRSNGSGVNKSNVSENSPK